MDIKNDPNVIQDQRLDQHDRDITAINTRIDSTNGDVSEVDSKLYLTNEKAKLALDKAKTAESYAEDALGTSIGAFQMAEGNSTDLTNVNVRINGLEQKVSRLEADVRRLVPR